jgi:hypothetical protein
LLLSTYWLFRTLFLFLHPILAINFYRYSDGDGGQLCDVRPPDCPVQSDDHPRGSVVGKNSEPVHISLLPGRAKFVAAGGNFCAAILEDCTLFTWGMGCSGELARSAEMTTGVDNDGFPDLGKQFFMTMKMVVDQETGMEYEKYFFNEDVIKEHFLKPKPVLWNTSLPKLKRAVTHVSCGTSHILVCARAPEDSSSRAYSAGGGAFGKLGHGDELPRHELTLVCQTMAFPLIIALSHLFVMPLSFV